MVQIESMSLEDIEATMAKLRERKQALKRGGRAAERKIATLVRRRECLMERVRQLDDEIIALRGEIASAPTSPIHRRGRRPKTQD